MRRGRSAGFTIVELMVVLVILGLLVDMILPHLVRGRMRALQAACETNERNIATAMQTYANTHGGLYPSDLTLLTQGSDPSLPTLPICPSGDASYQTLLAVDNTTGRFTIACAGLHYKQMPEVAQGFPQYASASGLDPNGEP